MLTINLSGRIDSNNAGIVEAEISSLLAENSGETPVFDAGNLEYISSAGLRVLLKFRKMFAQKLDVLNVSDDVYNIFDVSGFTELFNVRKKPREISVDGLEVIGGGSFSTVYRLDPERIVKIYNKKPKTLAEVEQDRLTSREVFTHGIPTAIPFGTVKAGEYYGQVYEMINADTMSGILARHPESLEELSIKAARLLKKLHTTRFEPGTFPDARDIQHSRVQSAFDAGLISADDKAVADGVIDGLPYRDTFIHSDFHTGNLMVSGGELILIDVGNAGLGNPMNDLLVSRAHFVEMGDSVSAKTRAVHEQLIGLGHETLSEVWKIIMHEYFGTTDKCALSHYSDVMSVYASVMMLSVSNSINRRGFREAAVSLAERFMTRLREAADTLRPIEGI